MSKALLVDILLALALASAVLSVLGLVVMRDVYQRLHYPAPLAAISVPLIVVAVWVQTNEMQARVKSVMVLVVLFGMNAVVSHATARAHRIRGKGHWALQRQDTDVERVE